MDKQRFCRSVMCYGRVVDLRFHHPIYAISRFSPRAALIQPITAATFSVILKYSPAAITSFGNSLLPMPRHATPALIQAVTLSSVASTPPVGMIRVHGMGPAMSLTNPGPPTELPGKILQISAPSSSACEISEALPHPGL